MKKKTLEPAGTEAQTVASVERALEVLKAFHDGAASLSLAQLAERTGLYKSTILRLAETLARHEYLVKLEDGQYQIGPQPFLLGARYQSSVIPAEWILPVLRRLSTETGESASFNIRHGEYRVCLWRVDSPHLLRDHTQPGDIRPLGKGAAGRLLRAFAHPLDPAFAALRRHPVSYSDGEIELGMAGIGVPVFGASGEIRGALGLSGPSARFTAPKRRTMEAKLWQAGMEITRRVGGDLSAFEGAKTGKPAARK